jgi:hypothetical protein
MLSRQLVSCLSYKQKQKQITMKNDTPSQPLDTMLSELSFTTEIPKDETIENSNLWNGLLCLSLSSEDENDLYFDALEEEIQNYNSADSLQNSNSEPAQLSLEDDSSSPEHESVIDNPYRNLPPPPPPKELPLRFIKAGKDDQEEGRRRYTETLRWRKELGMDTILVEPHPHFEIIKKSYPHFFHQTGRNGNPVFFEIPPKTDLKAMQDAGVTMDGLLCHYAMVTEFEWQFVDRSDTGRSICIIDLDGMRMRDFVGDCVDYVRKCSNFTGQHYPERAGFILVINVPFWFQTIWNVVKPMVDEVTLQKIDIIRGKEEVLEALLKKIPIENIPPEYGGKSMPLGQSPQEELLRDLMKHNMKRSEGDCSCGGRAGTPPCQFCSFVPARSY